MPANLPSGALAHSRWNATAIEGIRRAAQANRSGLPRCPVTVLSRQVGASTATEGLIPDVISGLARGEGSCRRGALPIIYNYMVVDLAEPEQVDRVFHALADATRRDIVSRTMQVEFSVSGLARLYPMSFAAVQKHVAVLEEAGLVTKRRSGREQLVSGNAATVREAGRLLDQLEALWRSRMDRFGEVLADDLNKGERR